MTAAEFKKKWSRYQGKETSGYSEHFNDLCRLLGQPTPAEADPSGSDFFCFQKRVVKDAELLGLEEMPAASEPTERGFADVWKKGCFAWEYKGKKKNLDEAYKQLLRYRESLLNPPLLVVCDFDRYIVKTNFNGTVQEVHEFTNDQIDRPDNLRVLRALFEDPEFLKPQRTTAQVTKDLAVQIAEIAKSLQSRESVELADAKSRKEVSVAQKKNLRIARFLNRIVFCFFAEDTGLLPKNLFTEIAKTGINDPKLFAETLEKLFTIMATGGTFGKDKIRNFNGHLFEEASVFELTEAELRKLAGAGEADWQFIEPSIMGTLFERALEPEQRSQLGAHYTSEADIKTLVEPVLMQPFRREWAKIKRELAAPYSKGKGNAAQRERLAKFQKQLSSVTVLDPACGSGNFLYVSLQLLLGLEKEVITFATQLGFALKPQVSVPQLKAIEINPYAFELAQVSVQIGYLQWRRDNGFDNDRTPVLQVLDGFQNEDALLVPHFRNKAKTLKEAQAGEHAGDDSLKFYTERKWPESDITVGNPPFLGTSKQWNELGREYCEALQEIYGGRVPGAADLCCYWFEKAREQIENGNCKRAGLLATQGIRGGANREVLESIKKSGDIFFAESSRDWILSGAAVNVSMIGFDDGSEKIRVLDGKPVPFVHSNLTANTADVTSAESLKENLGISFRGTQKSGDFDVADDLAREWLIAPNPNGKPNSDLLKPWLNGGAIVKRLAPTWIIDTGTDLNLNEFAHFEKPFVHVFKFVKPQRDENKREHRRLNWWLHAETCPGMRTAIDRQLRFLTTPRVSKFRLFSWADSITLPDDGIYIFARSDDFFFGIVHSRFHEVWSLKLCTRLETRPRYTPTTCFETFPFPFADNLLTGSPSAPQKSTSDSGWEEVLKKRFYTVREEPPAYGGGSSRKLTEKEHRASISAAAKELNELRERWLNPPEWTVEKILEFPGSVSGPWARFIDAKTIDAKTGIGTVRYPRIEPRDADCAAKLKKRTLTNLYNERPTWLDLAHKKLDIAVALAYGWNDFAEIIEKSDAGTIYDFELGGFALLECDLEGFQAAHEEFEREFAERILERLLALNLERAAEEAQAAQVKKPKAQRHKAGDELI